MVYAYTIGLAEQESKALVALPVFYPGSDTPDVGSSVDLRNSPEASGLSITVHETAGVKIEGVVGASPVLPEGSPVMLGLMIPGNPAQAFVGTRTEIGKPFSLSQVPPGSYILFAVAAGATDIRTFQPLRVSTQPIRGLNIVLSESKSIVGKAEIEQPLQPDTPEPRRQAPTVSPAAGVALLAECANLQLVGVARGVSDKQGEFHVNSVAAGETYALSIQPPPDAYVAKVTQGDRELAGGPFPVTGGTDPVHILLKKDGGKIEGGVKNKDEQSSPAFVVLAPKNRKAEHLFRTANAGSDGRFSLLAVAPAEYDLLAFDRNDEDSYFEEEYLRGFQSHSVAVTMQPNGHQFIGLEVLDTGAKGGSR